MARALQAGVLYRRGGLRHMSSHMSNRENEPVSAGYVPSAKSLPDGRRNFRLSDKKRIVTEARGRAASISGVARRYGITAPLLFRRRREGAVSLTATPLRSAHQKPGRDYVRPRDFATRPVRPSVGSCITSVGSPAAVIAPLHDVGALVFADVATLRHAERAIAAGVDGLVLLSAGAGGQTGWMNPLAFAREVRKMFDGVIVLAGGVIDGHVLWATQVLGCDLAYMGTRFIATRESLASDAYRTMLHLSSMDDVILAKAITGLETSILMPSILAAGLDPAVISASPDPDQATELWGSSSTVDGPKRWLTFGAQATAFRGLALSAVLPNW